jgi:hypothetical protein
VQPSFAKIFGGPRSLQPVLDHITEPMVTLDAEKASFTVVAARDWGQRVVK